MTIAERREIYTAQMKAQTFGCEVEMNSISREDAARAVAKYFGTEHTVEYEGGVYRTWRCCDRQGRRWKFERDVSIDGPEAEKCEMVTPVLHYEDMEDLQEVVRVLRHAGAKSCPSRGCGVHIHIGGDGHTAQSIANLANMMASHEDQLVKGIGISPDRLGRWCKPVNREFLEALKTKKPQTLSELSACWYGAAHTTGTQHYDLSRYAMLNLHAFFTRYHTIEFRLFQFDEPNGDRKGGLHAGQLKAMVQFCLAISQMAKTMKHCSAKKQQTENIDAYKTWHTRIGLVGDEFKTCREYLCRNFMSCPEWRASDEHRSTMEERGLWVAA